MPRYRYTLDEAAVAALGACEDAEFPRLVAAFEWISENPRQPGHTRRTLRENRPIELIRIGAFDIAFCADHARRHIWILEIYRI